MLAAKSVLLASSPNASCICDTTACQPNIATALQFLSSGCSCGFRLPISFVPYNKSGTIQLTWYGTTKMVGQLHPNSSNASQGTCRPFLNDSRMCICRWSGMDAGDDDMCRTSSAVATPESSYATARPVPPSLSHRSESSGHSSRKGHLPPVYSVSPVIHHHRCGTSTQYLGMLSHGGSKLCTAGTNVSQALCIKASCHSVYNNGTANTKCFRTSKLGSKQQTVCSRLYKGL